MDQKIFELEQQHKNIYSVFFLFFLDTRESLLLLKKVRNYARRHFLALIGQLIRPDKPISTGFLMSKAQYFCLVIAGI
jgi:hypothetical protein